MIHQAIRRNGCAVTNYFLVYSTSHVCCLIKRLGVNDAHMDYLSYDDTSLDVRVTLGVVAENRNPCMVVS